MSRCSPIFRQIYHLHWKIIVFKIEKQVLSSFPRAKILFLFNFQKICLCFLVGGFSIYGNLLS